ncbi:hypothetical protein SGM_2982 [Streptomyces griseoaurantiacus M045]|uniref:Uncharacterized protein n=1 Tax=Streptomyces griseoaurantiacus M045 TaxID=996637 RepID=F3NIL8_9ACTN|nr:hypothetical protein SGM_2982 [Streptomyces griseoaurantiacus M045]
MVRMRAPKSRTAPPRLFRLPEWWSVHILPCNVHEENPTIE